MISIVTISMNQGQFLPIAVESVLSQRHADFEYVIVDAGSTDGSRDYLTTLNDPRVRLILEPDEGPADGLNKGIRSSTGAFVGYINADDLYLEKTLSHVEQLFSRMPTVDVVYGDGWIIDDDGVVIRHFDSTPWGLRQYLYGGVSVLQQSTFFRRAAFDRTMGFNSRNATCWDGELLVDLALAGAEFHHVTADWAAFRLHAGGITGSGRLEARYRQDRQRFTTRAIGHDPTVVDGVLNLAARGAKLVRSPRYALRRARSRSASGRWLERGPDGYRVGLDEART